MRTIRDIIRERDLDRETEAAALATDALSALRIAGFPAKLVGSLARGEFLQHSDIDILIDADGTRRDLALRVCLGALQGHASSIVFRGDLPPDTLAQFEREATDGPRLRGR